MFRRGTISLISWGLICLLVSWVQSQGNRYRVNLDRLTKAYQYQKSEIEIHFHDYVGDSENNLPHIFNKNPEKFTFMKLGREEFLCDVGLSSNSSDKLSWVEMDERTKNYFKKSRISWLIDRCFNYTKRKFINNNLHIQIDIYEICFGVSIRHKKIIADRETETKITYGNFRLIGNYLPKEDIFKESGEITQFYRDNFDSPNKNRNFSASINFSCNNTFYGIKRVVEEGEHETNSTIYVEYQAPSFCDWRVQEHVGINTTENLNSILLPLENKCQNYTDSQFWSYELCNFLGVTQFKSGSSGKLSKSFILGLSPNIYSFFNSTSETKNELRDVLISSFIQNNTKGETASINVQNLNITLEPRNIDENFHNTYVPDKYVIALTLYNGTFCEESKGERSVKLVYECPDAFEKHSLNYFKIVNVVEKSFCEYEVLIQTSIICSHPLLLPPQNLVSENIKCFPRKSLSERLKNMEKKEGYLGQTGEAIDIIEYRNNQIEEVPMEYIKLFLDFKVNHPYFSLNTSLRVRRNNSHDPLFVIGELVQHKRWNYYGVVVGWDWKASAPRDWVDRVYEKYPFEYKKKPHYLILIHRDDTIFRNGSSTHSVSFNSTHSYVPEIAIKRIDYGEDVSFKHPGIVDNPYTSSYFSNWSNSKRIFVPNLNSTLWKTYPSDVQVTQRDEL